MQSYRKKISESSIQMKISFFVQSYQKEGFAQSEVSLKNFCMHELKIKALRYSDANKNIKQFLWILLLNETSLHPVLSKCTSDSPYRQFDDSDISISGSNCFALVAKPLLIKVFFFFHLKTI